MKKIVVTGGIGYIGSHTVVELLSNGYEVHILDNLSNSDISILDKIEKITSKRPQFTKLDLRNKSDLISFFGGLDSVAGVIHFAALKSVGESVKMPLQYYENNVTGTCNLLEALKKARIGSLVFSSSATVYGNPKILPADENTPLGHTPAPYGATKQMCERIIEDFTYSEDFLSAISLRYFNPIGAHHSRLIGELPTGPPNNLMPYITQTAVGIRECLSVFGDDYNTPDGTAVRDYIHVVDVAKAHVKAMQFLEQDKVSKYLNLNIGTGKGSTVLDVIKSFEKSTNQKLNYKISPRRQGDVETVYADVKLAKELLNWEALLNLDDMTSSAWKWEQELRKG